MSHLSQLFYLGKRSGSREHWKDVYEGCSHIWNLHVSRVFFRFIPDSCLLPEQIMCFLSLYSKLFLFFLLAQLILTIPSSLSLKLSSSEQPSSILRIYLILQIVLPLNCFFITLIIIYIVQCYIVLYNIALYYIVL